MGRLILHLAIVLVGRTNSTEASTEPLDQREPWTVDTDMTDQDCCIHIDQYDPVAPQLAFETPLVPCGVGLERELADSSVETEAGEQIHRQKAETGSGSSDTVGELITIDLMMLYTPEALARCGQQAMEDSIQYAVACANETLQRSRLPVELRLVHHGEVTGHIESGSSGSELSWLGSDSGVARLRNEYGADLVSMIVARGDHSGLANCSGSFSVTCRNPVVFTHEIGHCFGCSHDRAQPPVCARENFSYAHTFEAPGTGITFGTIMSYFGSVILNFSNPGVQFRGCATGIPEGHVDDSGRAVSADNARTILLAAPEVAMRKPNCVTSLERPGFDKGGSNFSFEIVAHSRETHSVEFTADFVRWFPLGHYDTSSGKATVVDAVPSVRARFYRASAATKTPPRWIGFYRLALSAGSSLIANQLDNGRNTVDPLLADLPVGCVLRKWDASAQQFIDNPRLGSGWEMPEMTLHPGEGAVLECQQSVEIIFVGQVRSAFYKPTDLGWSLVSSPVPQSGAVTKILGFPAGLGGQMDRVSTTVACYPDDPGWTCRDGVWDPEQEPEIGIGKAFWSYKPRNCHMWTRVLFPLSSLNCLPARPEQILMSVRHSGNSDLVVNAHTLLGGKLQLEVSCNLSEWRVVSTLTNETGQSTWTDPEGSSQNQRFYRVVRTDQSDAAAASSRNK